MSWDRVPLGELCSVSAGGTPSRSKSSNFEGTIPWVKISDMLQGTIVSTDECISEEGLANSSAKVFPEGTLLLSIFATVGRTAVLGIPAATNQAIAGITPRSDSKVYQPYLRHYLDASVADLIKKSRGVAQVNINLSILKDFQVPLPPLDEQRRIAAILDQAEVLRAKRRAAIAHLDQLLQAIFLEMFGDPVQNPTRWPMKRFGDLLASIDSGWSPTCLDRPATNNEWGVLKLGAVTKCEYLPTENKALPASEQARPAIEVKQGDLLFTRKNTYDLVAACALVRSTPPHLMMSDLIFRLKLHDDAGVLPTYVHQLLVNPHQRETVQRLAGGSSGSMPNISKSKLAELYLPLPPLELQRQFSARADAIHRAKADQQSTLAKLDELFAALQQSSFQGATK